MSSAIVESGLLSIALVIRSKDGPRFVFHYPPRPNTNASPHEILYGTELDSSESAINYGEDSDDSDLEGGGFSNLHSAFSKTDLNDRTKSSHVELHGDEHYDTPRGDHIVPWEHVVGWDTADLESILTPGKAYHKTKFEMSIDHLYFISYPLHIHEDGLWKKKKLKKSKHGVAEAESSGQAKLVGNDKNKATDNSDDEDGQGGMTMFNVVFIMSTAKEEIDARIATLYDNIIKKFSKALKHVQASSNYVWKESEMILTTKEKAREERKYSCPLQSTELCLQT